jgi:hypothetical protein
MSQVRSIPIFVVAAAVSLIVAIAADHLHHRFLFIIFGVVVCAIGYIIMLCMDHVHVGVRYFACFLITTGGYMSQPSCLTWLANQVCIFSLRSEHSIIRRLTIYMQRWEGTTNVLWQLLSKSESATAVASLLALSTSQIKLQNITRDSEPAWV